MNRPQRKVKQDLPVPPSLAAPSKDSQYIIPAGHLVLASPLVAQMDPRVWKDHDQWLPSRWTDVSASNSAVTAAFKDEDESAKVDYGFGLVSKGTDSPYQPFGAGRHRCIGEQFAYVQLSAIIGTIVRHMEMRIAAVPPQNYHVSARIPFLFLLGVETLLCSFVFFCFCRR
jgi:sterol 14-demethylase